MTGHARSTTPALSVIIGVQHAQEDLPDILSAIGPDACADTEVLLCHAKNDPVDPGALARRYSGSPG